MSKYNPRKCLDHKPTAKSVYFSGKFIHLTILAMCTGLSIGYISKIFRGEKQPSLKSAKRMADSLGMDFNTFVRHLEEHQVHVKKYGTSTPQEKVS